VKRPSSEGVIDAHESLDIQDELVRRIVDLTAVPQSTALLRVVAYHSGGPRAWRISDSRSASTSRSGPACVLIASDDLIAGLFNRTASKTGQRQPWTRERRPSMRSNYRIPVFKPAEDGIEPWLNLAMLPNS